MPVTTLITTITAAVTNVSFSECKAIGSASAFKNADRPGPGDLKRQNPQGQGNEYAEIGERRPPDGQASLPRVRTRSSSSGLRSSSGR